MLKRFFPVIAICSIAFAQNLDLLQDSLLIAKEKPLAMNLGVKPISDTWFSQDKFLHFSACASITGLTYHVYVCRLKGDENRGEVFSISLTTAIGIGKEVYDKKKKGHFSWKDLFWDGLGLAAGYFVFVH